jgi:hypothetical protein
VEEIDPESHGVEIDRSKISLRALYPIDKGPVKAAKTDNQL